MRKAARSSFLLNLHWDFGKKMFLVLSYLFVCLLHGVYMHSCGLLSFYATPERQLDPVGENKM